MRNIPYLSQPNKKQRNRIMKIVFIESLGICEGELKARTEFLRQQGHEIILYPDRTEDETELTERARDAEIIVISNIPLRKKFFESCPKLKMLSVAFTGVDHIDLQECRQRGIVVCNAAGYSTEAVAELTLGMMIAVYRKIVGGDVITRISESRQGILGSELHGKTVGIVGLGAIGQRVAQLALAFGCHVLAYNRSRKDIAGITQTDLPDLLSQSDIVSLHIPLTTETKDFIDAARFSLMQPHSILINTARGPIVNKDALYNALKKGQIAGAAIDVYDQEPPLPANYELFNAPNLLMLPHIGFATKEAFKTRLEIVIQNIHLWLAGTPGNRVA